MCAAAACTCVHACVSVWKTEFNALKLSGVSTFSCHEMYTMYIEIRNAEQVQNRKIIQKDKEIDLYIIYKIFSPFRINDE